MAALSEAPRFAPKPAPRRVYTPPALDDQPVTSAGPGLLRCALHGVFRPYARFGVPTGCRHCELDRAQQRTNEEAATYASILHERRLVACGLVGRYRNATFENFTATTLAQRGVLKACREYAETANDEARGTLMLLGTVGTGKTHLLCAMARHLRIERDVSAFVTTPKAIVRELRSTWAKDAERTEADVIAGLAEDLEVLLLDEVGLGFGSDAELAQLFEVIDARYALGHPTVTASNLGAAEMKAALGDRIFDRLREGAKVLACTWPSHRGAA